MQQSYSNTNTVNVSVYITANVVNINLGGGCNTSDRRDECNGVEE